jgi:hypothetical protein
VIDNTLINAKINTLIQQRNNALDTVVNLTGDVAYLQDKIKELEATIKAMENSKNEGEEVTNKGKDNG